MKKVLLLVAVGFSILSCGPSENELAKIKMFGTEAEQEIQTDDYIFLKYKGDGYPDSVRFTVSIRDYEGVDDASWLGTNIFQTKMLAEELADYGKFMALHPNTFRISSISFDELEGSDLLDYALTVENDVRMEFGEKVYSIPPNMEGWCQVVIGGDASNSYGISDRITGFYAFNFEGYVKELNNNYNMALISDFMFRF